ncbi:cysteine--tRNA ligase [uncultured Desulfosarcina sp.]|uniref:cysteine--tRNA ligase n=1 Tax=uncultured Desulfosarcina sp. TaxID=218289 RepID=UPI0029C8DBF0|nr:cysteine--tRNA ligase [uncultured Desulfosarcina sp.]
MNDSILNHIGNTPLVEIRRLNPNPSVRVLAKLEYLNPGGSIKDRPALSMIEEGERSGELKPGKTVIEATSGNTGIGLAMVCSVKGYRLLLAMSEAASVERQQILRARGAEILLTPGHLGTDGAIEEVYRLARENPDAYFMTDQYNNPANWKAHYNGTAVEIWDQTGGKLTHMIATMGTSGTLMGLSRRLKEFNPEIRIIGVEPYLGHRLQGLKNMKEAYQPEIFEKRLLDEKVNVEDEPAFEMTRRLAREEGLMVGMSSGAAMVVAAGVAASLEQGTLVVIFPDGGERYLSTPLFAVQEKIDLKLFNTMTHKKEPFLPVNPGKVSMYACGPTAHARMHVGEGRRFVFSDLLARYLAYRGYAVKQVMNITDLDDKTIEGSEQAGMSLKDFTGMHIESFHKDLKCLGIQPANHYPKASEHADDMVNLADRLVKKGYAYEKLRSIYFDISRFKAYGQLSGIDLNKIRIGATVDLDEYEKDNPRDFTLLKRTRLSELKRGIYTPTDWGNMRPSWHLQCAAMSMRYLGDFYDIHCAGRELVFPHHENEIAIAGALTGKTLAKYWVHCDRVLVDGKKVDEKGDALTIQGLLDMGYTGREIRYWLISVNYRKPVLFSVARLNRVRKTLKRLDACIRALKNVRRGDSFGELDQLCYDIKNGFTTAMDDDLNISAALASLFTVVKRINTLILERHIDTAGAEKVMETLARINTVMNIIDFEDETENPAVQQLMDERTRARQAKDWVLADRLRDQLLEMGVVPRDGRVRP